MTKCCAPQHGSRTNVGGEPVSTTVVDNQSTEAARGSPADVPIIEPAPVVILGAPTDGSADDTAVSEAVAHPDCTGGEAGKAEVLESVPNGSKPEPILGGDAQEADGQSADGQRPDGQSADCGTADGQSPDAPAADGRTADGQSADAAAADGREADARAAEDENHTNLGENGEPPAPDGRRTDVTATLSETDVLLEDVPADEALAPDTFATSAFDAEEPRTAAVWDAADVVTEIYHGHYNQLVRLAVLLVHDVQTAEEVVQDAFEAMHLAWRRLRDSEKALQYLRQTVVNRSRSVLRHRKVVDLHAPKPAPDEPSAEHAALALLERSAVAAALRSLPERQREAIALRYYADFSEADIAKAMGISKGAVKSHTARAMSSLKTILSQETP
jgi:RNA polymerase sigma-70 factor (sigma-E family)